MADYTNIPDANLEPGKPVRSIDGLALRDNPIAIAEGATGAPRVATAALVPDEQMTTANVLGATAGAAAGAVGTLAFLVRLSSVATVTAGENYTTDLYYAGFVFIPGDVTITANGSYGEAVTGTWKALGTASAPSGGQYPATLFLRVS